MTRRDMIDELSEELGIGKKICGNLLTTVQDEIVEALVRGERYSQQGFGVFSMAISQERVGRNPFTGQKMRFPKKRRMKFKPSSVLKEDINE
jgi:nucleoid DNA-binding protein